MNSAPQSLVNKEEIIIAMPTILSLHDTEQELATWFRTKTIWLCRQTVPGSGAALGQVVASITYNGVSRVDAEAMLCRLSPHALTPPFWGLDEFSR